MMVELCGSFSLWNERGGECGEGMRCQRGDGKSKRDVTYVSRSGQDSGRSYRSTTNTTYTSEKGCKVEDP